MKSTEARMARKSLLGHLQTRFNMLLKRKLQRLSQSSTKIRKWSQEGHSLTHPRRKANRAEDAEWNILSSWRKNQSHLIFDLLPSRDFIPSVAWLGDAVCLFRLVKVHISWSDWEYEDTVKTPSLGFKVDYRSIYHWQRLNSIQGRIPPLSRPYHGVFGRGSRKGHRWRLRWCHVGDGEVLFVVKGQSGSMTGIEGKVGKCLKALV